MKLDKYFEYAKSIGFTDVEFKVASSNKLSLKIFRKKVESYKISENETYSIRGIFNGNMVSGLTENKANIYKILDDMAQNAKLIEEKKEQELFEGSKKYKNFKTYSNVLDTYSTEDKINFCYDLEKKTKEYDSRIVDVEVNYGETTSSLKIVNSKGLNLSYKQTYCNLFIEAIARELEDTRTGMTVKIVMDLKDFDKDAIVKEVADEALGALNGAPVESKKYKIVMAPSCIASFIGILMSSVNGDQVNKGKSLLKDKLNQEIASKKFTMVEDPHCKEYPFFYRAFDDEGVATYKKPIIEKGVLKTFLYNIEASKVAKTTSTGNGYGGANIGISTALLKVKPGKKSKEELFEKVKDGLYITDVSGFHAGINPISGNFSLISGGYKIENGKKTTPVNLITIAGNIFEMFKDIVEFGNDSFLTYQGIEVPTVYIKKLAVSGK